MIIQATNLSIGMLVNHENENTVYFAGSLVLINPLRTKLYLSDLKNQSVPRSKHSLPLL
jgi:hypothetical protein